jgi:ABC-type nitrate/sulfonate/bicarbonate transport system substrate-binding protein
MRNRAHHMRIGRVALVALGVLLAPFVLQGADAAGAPVSIALPGVPPIIGNLVFFVARDQGFFKKQGVDVTLRPFDNGTAAAQAVATGNFDLSLSPTPGVIRIVANAGVPLVAIWGMQVPDWQLATVQSGATNCQQIKGQPVGVDAIGGARAVALQAFLKACGMTLADVQQVPLGSSIGPAMAAGQVSWGALHLDDVDTLQAQLGNTKLTIVSSYDKVDPVTHYLMLVTTKSRLEQKKDEFAHVVAALEEAAAWMQKPANLPAVAQIGTATGHPLDVMMKTVPRFLAIHYWPVDSSGLDRANVEHALDIEKTAGGLKPGKTVPDYDQFVTLSVWDAAKSLIGTGG